MFFTFMHHLHNYLTELFIMIGYLAQEKLYCSHEMLHLSIIEPTMFLQISGEQIANLHLCS